MSVCVSVCVCVCVSQVSPSAIPQHCAGEQSPGELNTVIKPELSLTVTIKKIKKSSRRHKLP